MPQKKIPCTDCQSEAEAIEQLGNAEVISCDPIEGEPGWCLFVWRFTD